LATGPTVLILFINKLNLLGAAEFSSIAKSSSSHSVEDYEESLDCLIGFSHILNLNQ